jgi:replicative DNA helicase
VIILHRDDDESEKLTKDYGRPTVKVEARILKNRNGELATVHFTFTPAWALFDETATEALEWSEALGKDRRSPIP